VGEAWKDDDFPVEFTAPQLGDGTHPWAVVVHFGDDGTIGTVELCPSAAC